MQKLRDWCVGVDDACVDKCKEKMLPENADRKKNSEI